MEGYAGTISPPGMYVRALYDYNSDDHTSLTFQAGDIIEVLTQLESGWWDGVIHGQRGWFPSNYCVMVEDPEARRLDEGLSLEREADSANQTETEPESEDDYDDRDLDSGYHEHLLQTTGQPQSKSNGAKDHEAAAFWIPQVTQDGTLYYHNTLTGVSTMELPLESPASMNEGAPRDPANLSLAGQARAAPELLARGVTVEDNSTSDQRNSYVSDGASPTTSMESLGLSSPAKSSARKQGQAGPPSSALSTQQLTGNQAQGLSAATRFQDDAGAVALTWDQLIEDMRQSIARYRQAINSNNRSDFVRRAEDVSDHLRLILAAGSHTTDNHSGNPSIITINKELYPRFRDMMSRFSKLVLNSHIAAADWPPAGYESKCLQDARGVLEGVYGYIEVARQQRGEDIPRLFPGFVAGYPVGGSWQNNGVIETDLLKTEDGNAVDGSGSLVGPKIPLDSNALDQIRDLFRNAVAGIRRLEQRLLVQDKIINRQRHTAISRGVSLACEKMLLETHRPWMSLVESIDLSPFGSQPQTPQLGDFFDRKQRVYNLIAELVIACQAVGAPLADEWAEKRGSSLEDRINHVQFVVKEYELCISRTTYTLERLIEVLPAATNGATSRHTRGADSTYSHQTTSSKDTGRSLLGDISQAAASSQQSPTSTGALANADNAKVRRFFGEVPNDNPPPKDPKDPWFMKLDHEGEVRYDREKSTDTAPSIRGGTLVGLVEQLARHDLFNKNYVPSFLLTYKSFTTATELFEMLMRRWSIIAPPGLTEEEYRIWATRKQGVIRLRVVNVFKTWMEYYWVEGDDEASRSVLQRLHSFAVETVAPAGIPGHKQLIQAVDQRLRGEEPDPKRLVPNEAPVPMPILPKNMRKMKFNDIDPMEYARQLTIIDFKLYVKIKPQECLGRLWNKKTQSQDGETATQIRTLINHSNHLTNWVADMIVSFPEVKKRAAVIKHFVAVAEKCQSVNNFSALTAILAAFGSSPIHRLNKTWAQVDKKTKESVERLRTLMSSVKNFATYRDALHSAAPPCIPFLGVYLTDLTFIDEANSSYIKKTDLINFAKRSKIADVIKDIQVYQNKPYNFKSIPELQDYILDSMQRAPDVSEVEMYDRSLRVEPREREDEKIARLLTESGYI